ncbi:metal-dependent hydrolase family protein [Piscinibacter defluvii]|uniref:metal-dependent hydrolase family protein n=1 Tax=Piscinibacter defluvii TaxID=1796922 RepID=UPI000FDEB277|nr:amidohydrolase family protein [Piscinibacter defluvii]
MRTLIRDCMVWDGSGAAPFPAEVLVEGERIVRVGRGVTPDGDDVRVIDAAGMTLMPGLVEGHAHLSFCGAQRNTDLGDIPPEEHVIETLHNARTLLDAGFTSAYSAASAKLRLDVVVRNEVNSGRSPGPRIRAASPEITVTGGLGDENRLHMNRSSFGIVADGPEAIVQAVRTCIREGVDNIKLNISGDDFVPAKGGMTVMRETEVRAACEVAHDFGRRVASHSRAGNAVKRAVQCGVDVIYHCEMADGEALDLLEAARDRLFVGPAIGLIHNTLHEAEPWGITKAVAHDLGMERCLENSQRTYEQMRKRGIRVVIGGDYGFAWTPQGTNARDIEHFVRLFGYTPSEALQCATRIGGELMGLPVGQVREGLLADLLLVDGDPLQDVRLLQDRSRLRLIMKGGAVHKDSVAEARPAVRRAA